MDHWLLDSIEVNDGFLDRLSLHFPRKPGLICIIGPRGSGKSTLTEALRHGMGEPLGTNPERKSLIENNLTPSKITLRASSLENEGSFIVHRRGLQPSTISKADGAPLSNIDLERSGFLRLDAYGYKEIESIAQENWGPKRRQLIDELQREGYDKLLLNLSNLRRELDANADAIRNERRKEDALVGTIEELRSATDELKAVPVPELSTDDAQLFARAEQQIRRNSEEIAIIKTAVDRHAQMVNQVQELAQQGAALHFQSSPESENLPLMNQALTVTRQTESGVQALLHDASRMIEQGAVKLRDILQNLSNVHAKQNAEFQSLETKHRELSKHLEHRGKLLEKVRQFEKAAERRIQIRNEIDRLLRERSHQKGSYLLEREHRSNLREEITKRLQEGLEKRVRIGVHRNADNLKYETMLLEGLRGARLRNHDDIKSRLLGIRPEDLAEMIRDNDVVELNKQSTLGEERCRKILESFRANVDPFEMEVVEFEDRIAIELNVGKNDEPHFKDAKDLSSGQKCTALLPLLLARRDVPLIIDQPEDNLDNHYIYKTVVKAITKLKTRRQMIFVTHNANIPVLGDADLVVVMNSDGRRGFISKVGTVDECRGEIIDLLEGGEDAFEERRRRYEQ